MFQGFLNIFNGKPDQNVTFPYSSITSMQMFKIKIKIYDLNSKI